jgi:hypothetical protein
VVTLLSDEQFAVLGEAWGDGNGQQYKGKKRVD